MSQIFDTVVFTLIDNVLLALLSEILGTEMENGYMQRM